MARRRYQWDADAPEETQDAQEVLSRSEKKRRCLALQELAEDLARLPAPRLQGLPLTPDLHAALLQLPDIPGREARRRQLQYLGRLMRDADADAIRAALERMKG